MSQKKVLKIEDYVAEYKKMRPLCEEFCKKILDIVDAAIDKEDINIHSITYRAKDTEKFAEKIEKEEKEYSDPLKEITDLSGVRVITYFPKDVDSIIPLIEGAFEVDEDNTVDKRKLLDPDRFGYSSVHYVVLLDKQRLKQIEYSKFKGLKCEIQIRTILQHAWAEIEHDIAYKSQRDIPRELIRRFSILSGLLELADKEFESIRHDEIELDEKISGEIYRGELNIPIDYMSLKNFIGKNEILAKYKDTYDGIPVPDDRIRELIEEIEVVRITDIKTLDEILNAYPIEKCEEIYSAMDHKLHPGLRPYPYKSKYCSKLGVIRHALAYYNLEDYLTFIKKNRKWSDLDSVIKSIEAIMEDQKK